jgi:hypothetical protein
MPERSSDVSSGKNDLTRDRFRYRPQSNEVAPQYCREVAQSSIWTPLNSGPAAQTWIRIGSIKRRPVALAEAAADIQGSGKPWSPTRNLSDAQQVRTKLAETFQFVLLGRLAAGALFIFAMVVDRPPEEAFFAVCRNRPVGRNRNGVVCPATVQINAEIQDD